MFYKIVLQVAFFIVLSAQANLFENIKTFQANFTQTITNSSDKNIEYSGEVFMKGNARILWKYQEPIIKNVFINNSYAIVDEPELEQAIYTKLHQEVNVLDIFQNAQKVDDSQYKTTLYDIEYTLFLEKGKVKSIKYIDALENKINIEFQNIKENIELPNDLFEFYPPLSYDIIRK